MQKSIEKISFIEANEKYSLGYVEDIYDDDMEVLVFHDDMFFETLDIDKQTNMNSSRCACIFLKNLTVSQSLIQPETDFGPLFIVHGNVEAQNIFVGGAEIYFLGDVTVHDAFIAGVYNHGMLTVEGKINAKVLYSFDHFFSYKEDKVEVPFNFLDEENTYAIEDLFFEDYIDDEYLDEDNLIEALKSGTKIIKDVTFKTDDEKRYDHAQSTGFTQLDLDDMDLTELPDYVGQHNSWTEIILDRNNVPKLPEYFSTFDSLKKLSLYFCEYEQLPSVVTKLKSLKNLDLSYNHLNSLPQEFSDLTHLEILNLRMCKFERLPSELSNLPITELNLSSQRVETFVMQSLNSVKVLNLRSNKNLQIQGEFENLEELNLEHCELSEFPETILNSKKLKNLSIDGNPLIKELPSKISQLSELASLTIPRNIRGIEHLASLKNLKNIYIKGINQTPKFLEDILALQYWEIIELPEYCSIDMVEKILQRPNLKEIHVANRRYETVESLRKQLADYKAKNAE